MTFDTIPIYYSARKEIFRRNIEFLKKSEFFLRQEKVYFWHQNFENNLTDSLMAGLVSFRRNFSSSIEFRKKFSLNAEWSERPQQATAILGIADETITSQ